MTRYLATALVLLAATPAHAEEKTLERTFAVAAGGVLTVEADSASVKVSGSDTNKVVVRMTASGSKEDLDTAKLEAFQKDNGVTVMMARRRGIESWFKRSSWNRWGHIEVTVPRRYEISVRTSGGGVELTNTIGPVKLRTSGGDIVAKNLNGAVEAQTSGGGIFADTIRGDVAASTSGGDVRLLQVDGKITAQTSGGGVQCSLVGVNRGISATTSGGSIQLTLPRNTTANIEATQSGGEFSSDLPVATTEREDGHVKGLINGGGQPIDVSTSGGGISLRSAN